MATTKKDLVDRIAKSTGTTHARVKAVIQEFFNEIISELAKGNRLEFRDFGVFETKTTPTRMAQNPRTIERVCYLGLALSLRAYPSPRSHRRQLRKGFSRRVWPLQSGPTSA